METTGDLDHNTSVNRASNRPSLGEDRDVVSHLVSISPERSRHSALPFHFVALKNIRNSSRAGSVCERVQLNANVLSAMLTLDTGGGACTVKRLVGGQLDVSTGALTAAVVYGARCCAL